MKSYIFENKSDRQQTLWDESPLKWKDNKHYEMDKLFRLNDNRYSETNNFI